MRRIVIQRETKLSGLSFAAQFEPPKVDPWTAWLALWFWWL